MSRFSLSSLPSPPLAPTHRRAHAPEGPLHGGQAPSLRAPPPYHQAPDQVRPHEEPPRTLPRAPPRRTTRRFDRPARTATNISRRREADRRSEAADQARQQWFCYNNRARCLGPTAYARPTRSGGFVVLAIHAACGHSAARSIRSAFHGRHATATHCAACPLRVGGEL